MPEFKKNARELINALSTMRRAKAQLHSYNDLNFSEMLVFTALMTITDDTGKNNLIQMNEISREIDISKPALSQIVNKLEDKGMVERVFSKEDRRATYLTFTDQGKVIYKREKEILAKMANTLVEKMGEEDTEQFIKLLYKFNSIIEHDKKGHCNQGDKTI